MRFPATISTERMLLRLPRVDDAEELNAAIRETWDQLHRWMAWAKVLPTIDASRERCARMAETDLAGESVPYFGFEPTERLAVAVGVRVRDPEVPFLEIGYWCRASHQGRGLVTEAVTALTQVGFSELGAHRIEIRCDAENRAAQAVALRCGYVQEGELKHESRDAAGRLRAVRIFAQTRG